MPDRLDSDPATGRTDGTRVEPAGLTAFVVAWATALDGTCLAPANPSEVRDHLRELAGDLAAALHAEPFDKSVGYRVGAGLVAADFADAQTVGRTVELLDARLLSDLGLAGEEIRQRLRQLIAAVSTGYGCAARPYPR